MKQKLKGFGLKHTGINSVTTKVAYNNTCAQNC